MEGTHEVGWRPFMPPSTLSGHSVALLRVRLDDCTPSEGQLISHGNCARSNFCRGDHGHGQFAADHSFYGNRDRQSFGYRKGNTCFVVVGNSDPGPIARFLHHGTSGHDDLRPSTASSFL